MTQAVVDTSALIALSQREDGHAAIALALSTERFIVPAPAIVEFWRVARRGKSMPVTVVERFLRTALTNGDVAVFGPGHADAAAAAGEAYGVGNGRGGKLNLIDLMVYAVAMVEQLPILCTGKDFASTDAAIHPASRIA